MTDLTCAQAHKIASLGAPWKTITVWRDYVEPPGWLHVEANGRDTTLDERGNVLTWFVLAQS